MRTLNENGASFEVNNPHNAYITYYNLAFLKPDMFYILDETTPELYLFTPSFADRVNLAHNMNLDIRKVLETQKVDDNSFPLTPCCQGGFVYHVRIPYFQGNQQKPEGYFYIPITDSTPVMYDEMYWGADHKMHAKRRDVPIMKVGPHSAHIYDHSHYLPGAPKDMPDFPDDKSAGNKKAEYYPLDVEEKLRNVNSYWAVVEAHDLMVSSVRYGLSLPLPKVHKAGERAECWGHLGCNYTYTKEEVEREREARIKRRADIVHSCQPVADEFHLNIPPETP